MPGIINSAPDCVTHVQEASADDMADFILQANYQDCAGFMTFGPGSTYGEPPMPTRPMWGDGVAPWLKRSSPGSRLPRRAAG